MTNNDILRRLRYTFSLKDAYVKEIFSAANSSVTRDQIVAWMTKEGEEGYTSMADQELATFLNGFINVKRGKREGEQPIQRSSASERSPSMVVPGIIAVIPMRSRLR